MPESLAQAVRLTAENGQLLPVTTKKDAIAYHPELGNESNNRCRWASGSFTVLRFASRGRRDC